MKAEMRTEITGGLPSRALGALLGSLLVLSSCSGAEDTAAVAGGEEASEEPRGANGGRLILVEGLQIESLVDEGDDTPRFRVWVTRDGEAVKPETLDAEVRTTRLGGERQVFALVRDGASLVSTEPVPEPHSFDVEVAVTTAGRTLAGSYASYETRTTLEPEVAAASGVTTELAGPAKIRQTLAVYGSVVADPQRVREIRARFSGIVTAVSANVGDRVRRGAGLVTIESNESLQPYVVRSPIDGQVIGRSVNPGDAVDDEVLFVVADLSRVWAEFAVFRRDLARVRTGATVTILGEDTMHAGQGKISYISPVGSSLNQSLTIRVPIDNADGQWVPGLFLRGQVVTGEQDVPLAVRNSAIQQVRGLPVVFERVGNIYEARFIEPGAADREMTQVLAGLAAGASYVVEQSYVIKADVEKAGAEHSH